MKNISQAFADVESTERMEQVQKTRQKWIEEGDQLLKWRENLRLSRAFVARETGVDNGRLTRLEHGEPVKEAKLISKVYKLTLEKIETHRALATWCIWPLIMGLLLKWLKVIFSNRAIMLSHIMQVLYYYIE